MVTKVSVRTRGDLAAYELVSELGGGGHFRAAGAEVAAPLADVRERVLGKARSMINREARD